MQDCSGKEHWKGVTDARGVARISKELPDRREPARAASDEYDRQYMVFARAGRDVSFVLSSWDEGISRWRFNLPAGSYNGPYIATAVFDRTLLRTGESVHMKLLYRQHTRAGFRFVNAAALPATATIEHQGSEQRYELPLKWDARNSAELDWKVPRDAKTGVYRVRLEDTLAGQSRRREAGSFRVEEFRVPLMRAGIEGAGQAAGQCRERAAGRAGELSRRRRRGLRAGQAAQRGAAACGERARLRRVRTGERRGAGGPAGGPPRRLVPRRVPDGGRGGRGAGRRGARVRRPSP